MREYIITGDDASQRLNKYLRRLLPQAAEGFLYKMLRKKNITVNSKKADGSKLLSEGDVVRIYFSEDTFLKFSTDTKKQEEYDRLSSIEPYVEVIYEEDDFLLLNKPAGLLSHQAKQGDISLNELMLSYLIRQNKLNKEAFLHFRPSVMNRLDYGTSGIVIASKTLKGASFIASSIASGTIKKEYTALVHGQLAREGLVKSWLKKDSRINKVTLFTKPVEGAVCIENDFSILETRPGFTLVGVHLITGKSHQIRSQLAAMGNPIVLDRKYGDPDLDRDLLCRDYKGQLLHAARLTLPDGRVFEAGLPKVFQGAKYGHMVVKRS